MRAKTAFSPSAVTAAAAGDVTGFGRSDDPAPAGRLAGFGLAAGRSERAADGVEALSDRSTFRALGLDVVTGFVSAFGASVFAVSLFGTSGLGGLAGGSTGVWRSVMIFSTIGRGVVKFFLLAATTISRHEIRGGGISGRVTAENGCEPIPSIMSVR